MPLLPLLRAEAERRGLAEPGATFDAARCFALVRDMPYARASDRDPGTVLREWRGTCSGKHLLLEALLGELGYASMLMLALHEFTPENTPWLPPELRTEVERAAVPDVHVFLRVESDPAREDRGWMTVDATWPLAAGALGLPVNERWVTGRDMRVACDPIEVHHVPEGEDALDYRDRILEREVAGEQAARRDRFIEGLARWLASATSTG